MREFLARLGSFAIQILSVFADTVFLAIWVLINWAADHYILSHFKLDGVHTLVVPIFRIVFAISTLFPIVIYIAVDLFRIFVRAQLTVRGLKAQSVQSANTRFATQEVSGE